MIRIRSRVLEQIINHCKKGLPFEACGVLAGKIGDLNGASTKDVLKAYDCKNELNSSTRYRIGAEEQLRVFKEIDDLNMSLLGFYHSHVSSSYTSAEPSAVDQEKANYIGYSYLIITLQPAKVSSWILEEVGVFKEEELRVV